MAKAKKQVQKTPKKHSTKYSKLAAVCSKELAAKKKALATAEKALAKAQRSHSELLSEVARLDMLDRSLTALINGTEPPQNVRYVYNYPQWVYYPYNGWYWNNGNYSLTLGNVQSGQFTTNVTPSITTSNAVSISTPTVYSTCGSGSLMASAQCNSSIPASGSFTNCSDSSLIGYDSSGIGSGVSLTASAPSSFSFTTAAGPTLSGSTETVDLSTGAADPEDEFQQKFEAKMAEHKAEEKAEKSKAQLGDALLNEDKQ